MMNMNSQVEDAFFTLLQAGLWEHGVSMQSFESLDFDALYRMAEDQSVVGLLAAGLEHIQDRKVKKPEALPFMKKVFSLENRNSAMNSFLEQLVGRMQQVGIYSLLVKGQGIAQCYERPLWRSSGDIDLFLDERGYVKAKSFLAPLSSSTETEGKYAKHFGMTIESWKVELHGTLRCGLAPGIDKVIDTIQEDTFAKRNVRTWRNGIVDIFLPDPNADIIYTFTHFIKHFYRGGVGLRQICDWCRLLWAYRNTIDGQLLNERVGSMRLKSEWKAFAAFVVKYLGMPCDSMPLYDSSKKWDRKAVRIRRFILKSGNFGHNRDQSYFQKYHYVIRKTISLSRRLRDLTCHAFIFPIDSLRFFPTIVFNGILSAARGE